MASFKDKVIAAKAANLLKNVRNIKRYPHECPLCKQWHLSERANA